VFAKIIEIYGASRFDEQFYEANKAKMSEAFLSQKKCKCDQAYYSNNAILKGANYP
jgi:hypothetical protein